MDFLPGEILGKNMLLLVSPYRYEVVHFFQMYTIFKIESLIFQQVNQGWDICIVWGDVFIFSVTEVYLISYLLTHSFSPSCTDLLTYLLTYSLAQPLTSWSSPLEANRFSASQTPHILWTWRFITAFTNACHQSLSWASLIQSIPPHPTSWRSIWILSSCLCLGLPSVTEVILIIYVVLICFTLTVL